MEKSVECPVCGRLFYSDLISEHANSCLNSVSKETENRTRKRKSADWGFLTGYSKHGDKIAANSAKVPKSTKSQSVQSKGKSKETNNLPNSEGLASKEAVDCNEADSASDVEFVDVEVQEQLEHKDIRPAKEQHNPEDVCTVTRNTASKNATAALFTRPTNSKASQYSNIPLAERARPHSLDSFVGQDQAVGRKGILHSLITHSNANIPSMIVWGPPGCGKTTLAKIVAHKCKEHGKIKFITMSATSASVKDVKDVAKVARNDLKMFHKKTILFLDEIHRFNKAQQDVMLPHVEDGTITLIGATTENPSFYVNGALLSRCRVITLEKLKMEDIVAIIKRALPLLGVCLQDECSDEQPGKACNGLENRSSTVVLESVALDTLAGLVDGDARTALNGLQLAVEGSLVQHEQQLEAGDLKSQVKITVDIIKEALQRSHVLYDKAGEEHYNTISALIKSMRGSDPSAALYWMMRILEGGEIPLYIARRLVIFASEDVGLADPLALTQAVSTHQACHVIGMPECAYNLAHCVTYLARAPKSIEVKEALQAARECVKNQQGALPPIPLHLRNAPTKLMKTLGYGKDYKYPPHFSGPVEQDYFPPSLVGTDFFPKT